MKQPTDKDIQDLILAILQVADYDLWKFYNQETSEDWDVAEGQLEDMTRIAKGHLGL